MIVLELCERCRGVAFRASCNVTPMCSQKSRLLFNGSIKQDSRIIWLDMTNSDGAFSFSHTIRVPFEERWAIGPNLPWHTWFTALCVRLVDISA